MRIAINALSVNGGGGLTSMLNLLPAIDKVDQTNEYFVFISKGQETTLSSLPLRFVRIRVAINPRRLWQRFLFDQLLILYFLLKFRIDWLYSTGNTTTLLAPCKVFLLIENANPYSSLHFNYTFRDRLRLWILRLVGYCSAKKAAVVRFPSENARRIIARKDRIPLLKTCVIAQGVVPRESPPPQGRGQQTIAGRYLLSVADLWPHKNIGGLMKAFDILCRKYQYEGSLIIAGRRIDVHHFLELESIWKSLSRSARISFLDWIAPDDLLRLYSGADVFVLTSVEESFGMPVIEALASGTPVAVSSNPGTDDKLFLPFRELCGDSAEYFNPFDPDDIAYHIQKIIDNQELRQYLSGKGLERSRMYSWERVASQLVTNFK